jgi:hypothetical protein
MANENDPSKPATPGSGAGKTEPGDSSGTGTGKTGHKGGDSPDGLDQPPQIKIFIAAAFGGLIGGLVGALIGHCIRA